MIFLLNKNTIWWVYAFFKMSIFLSVKTIHDFKCPVHTDTCLTQFYATVFKNPRFHLFAWQSKSIFKTIVLRNSPPTKPFFDGVLGRFTVRDGRKPNLLSLDIQTAVLASRDRSAAKSPCNNHQSLVIWSSISAYNGVKSTKPYWLLPRQNKEKFHRS